MRIRERERGKKGVVISICVFNLARDLEIGEGHKEGVMGMKGY